MAEADVPVLAQSWESALPDAILTLDPDDVPVLAHIAETGESWRIEVTGRGRYWQWRKGRGKDRTSRYGGRFEQLSAGRQSAYYKNRLTKARTARAPAAAAHPG